MSAMWRPAVVTIILGIFISGQVHGSQRQQRHLHSELSLLGRLEAHIQQTASHVERIQRWVSQLVAARSQTLGPEDILGSPLTVEGMVRRLAEDWPALLSIAGTSSGILKELGGVRWPSRQDVAASAKTVVRSQLVYNLSTEHLAQGIITDSTVTNISAADCFNIATAYYHSNHFDQAVQWLEQALAKISSGDSSCSRQAVLQYLAPAMCYTGDSKSSKAYFLVLSKEYPRTKLPDNIVEDYREIAVEDCRNLNVNQRTEEEKHKRLCQGGGKVQSGLRCRYVHYQQHHLRFQPFKLEELQLDPPVVRFYDVITDSETEDLKNASLATMYPAKVYGKDGFPIKSDYRTSEVSWLMSPKMSEVDVRLAQRMMDMTQLDVAHAEYSQLSRYGASGEYMPHRDYLVGMVPFYQDRIATLMFYLSEVKAGGHTVFLSWELSVPPIKNSAVLWFNYLPDGEHDVTSDHSGCPVLLGSKWVLNKWFSNSGEVSCPLNKNASFKNYFTP